MDVSPIGMMSVPNLGQCVLELISNALDANARTIAIRINKDQRKIQLIENGRGMTFNDLQQIAEYSPKSSNRYYTAVDISNRRKCTLVHIRKLSDALIIVSRHCNSSNTYMKVFKVDENPRIVEVKKRSSQGTTVTIYGFHELAFKKWDEHFMHHLVANVAIVHPNVSFSIRDDRDRKVTLLVTAPHSPIYVFKHLYSKVPLHKTWNIESNNHSQVKFSLYIGFTNMSESVSQNIFLNNKTAYCPLIAKLVTDVFLNAVKFFRKEHLKKVPKKRTVFMLLFIWSKDYIFIYENGRKSLILPSIQFLMEDIRCKIMYAFVKNIKPLSVNSKKSSKHPITGCISSRRSLISCRLSYMQQYSCRERQAFSTPCHVIRKKVVQSNVKSEPICNSHHTMVVAKDTCKVSTPVSYSIKINKQIELLTLSEWSNWTPPDYGPNNLQSASDTRNLNHFPQFYKRFDFVPEKLQKLLRGNSKLVRTDILNKFDNCELLSNLKLGLKIPDVLFHQETNVRLCKAVPRLREIMLKKELLKFIKILGQMNKEMIVGLLTCNNMKLLIIMDQHAVHERIRYEDLLNGYKSQIRNELFSVKLRDPIEIQLSVQDYNLLLSNESTVKRYGITFNVTNNDTVMIRTVPECLRKNKYHFDEFKLKVTIENLLSELLQAMINSNHDQPTNLPPTIHNALAMTACHGAIKFGAPLTLNQCKSLLKSLIETKIPTQCAHGRPSIIPLLELNDLDQRHKQIIQGILKSRCPFRSN